VHCGEGDSWSFWLQMQRSYKHHGPCFWLCESATEQTANTCNHCMTTSIWQWARVWHWLRDIPTIVNTTPTTDKLPLLTSFFGVVRIGSHSWGSLHGHFEVVTPWDSDAVSKTNKITKSFIATAHCITSPGRYAGNEKVLPPRGDWVIEAIGNIRANQSQSWFIQARANLLIASSHRWNQFVTMVLTLYYLIRWLQTFVQNYICVFVIICM